MAQPNRLSSFVPPIELEDEPNPTVDDATVERCPGIHGPSPVRPPIRAEEAAPPGLANVRQILQLEKHSNMFDDLPFAHNANDHALLLTVARRTRLQPS